MKKGPRLGEQEWQILKSVQDHGPLTVREVADKHSQWARTTVLTVLERLRAKGFAQRQKIGGVFQYSARQESEQFVQKQIGEFVDRALSGSLSPLFRFLFAEKGLTDDEKNQLGKIVERIEKERGEE